MEIFETSRFKIDFMPQAGLQINTSYACDNAEDFIQRIKLHRQYYQQTKAGKVLWDHTAFDYHIPPGVQKWVDEYLNVPDWSMVQHLPEIPRLGFVMNADALAHLSVVEIFEQSESGFRPRFFADRDEAVQWMLDKKSAALKLPGPPIIHVQHNALPGKTQISLTIDNDEVHEYMHLLSRLLRKCQLEAHHLEKFLQLSKREKQLLPLLIRSLTDKQIAARLIISYETARTHRKNIMAKLECRKVAELHKYAYFI